ncbi:cyclic pyranopterin monophosphate synthase MoaC [Myxococcota bacterium]|nr:cyclic pyranopterin monophosphate synthase MoaC [Myxococcota bacterium]
MSERLTHVDEQGHVRMVDVGGKPVTHRVCLAAGEVLLAPDTLARIVSGETPKGDVLATARLAGIQACKRTADWIPLAHPLPLDAVEVEFFPETAPEGSSGHVRLRIEATAHAHARTGVEMEALVAVSAAGLTIYDMCKAIDRGMVLANIRLLRKSGGKSGVWEADPEPPGGTR